MGLCLGAGPREGVGKLEIYEVNKKSSGSSGSTSTNTSTSSSRSTPRSSPSLERLRSLSRHESIEDDYQIGEQVGEGSIAVVHSAIRKSDSEEVALKIISKGKLYPDEVDDVLQEVEALTILDHPNIVGLKEFAEDEDNYYVVMDLVKGGELRHRITSKTVYTENEARDLFVTLVSTIKYIHDKDVVHRDLKLDNLLLVGACDVTVKIADFGVAAVVHGEQECLTKLCGTPWYIAPEILEGRRYGKAVDMWSVGVILYILLGGSPPFYDRDEERLFEKIKNAQYHFAPKMIWECVSDEAKDLITKLLTLDTKKRLTAAEALEHPWVKESEANLRSHSLQFTQNELLAGQIHRSHSALGHSINATHHHHHGVSMRGGCSIRGSQGIAYSSTISSFPASLSMRHGCSIRGIEHQNEGFGLVRTTQMLGS